MDTLFYIIILAVAFVLAIVVAALLARFSERTSKLRAILSPIIVGVLGISGMVLLIAGVVFASTGTTA